jgi:SAM-dependent methyltransferase
LSKQLSFEQAVQLVAQRLPLRGFSREAWVATYAERHRDAYKHIIGTVERHLPPGAAILDYGAGLCDKTALVSLRGYRCTAADDFGNPLNAEPGFSDGIVEFAKSFDVEVADVRGGLPFARESFDMVMMHDVIEHLHDSPRELLNDLVECLRPGGLLFITVPSAVNIRKRIDVLFGRTNLPRYDTFYWYPGPWRGHVREYTGGDLEALNHFLGLEKVELHACHHMLSVVPRRLRPLYRAVTAVVPSWRDSWCYVGRKPAGWRPSREVSPEVLDGILRHLNR